MEDSSLTARKRKNKRSQRRVKELRMTLDQNNKANQTKMTKIWKSWMTNLSKHKFQKVIKKTTS